MTGNFDQQDRGMVHNIDSKLDHFPLVRAICFLGTFPLVVFYIHLTLRRFWSTYMNIEPGAWLGFWGTLLGAAIAAFIAMRILATQLGMQKKQFDAQLRQQSRHFREQQSIQERLHQNQLTEQRALHQKAMEAQSEEARRDREIQTLGTLNTLILQELGANPEQKELFVRNQLFHNFAIAVTNWKMNWGIEKANDLKLDLDLVSLVGTLSIDAPKRTLNENDIKSIQKLKDFLLEFAISRSEYVHLPASDRRRELMAQREKVLKLLEFSNAWSKN